MCICSILALNFTSVPWTDEIGTADTAINFVLYGRWNSDVWVYMYQPLHALLLICWLKIWGISHVSVCAMNVIIAFGATCLILKELLKRNLLTNFLSVAIFVSLYWYFVPHSNGRIDMLTLLLTTGMVVNLVPFKGYTNYKKLGVYSFLLMASSIYSIPILLVGGVFLLLFYRRNRIERKILVRKFWVVFCVFSCTFLLVLVFFFIDHHPIKYLHQFISFNANAGKCNDSLIYRVLDAYKDIVPLILLAIGFFYALLKKNRILLVSSIFVFFIPFLMVLAGRYQLYYRWIFDVPVVAIFANVINSLKLSKLKFIFILVIFLYPSQLLYAYIKPSKQVQLKIEREQFVLKNHKYFTPRMEVYALDGLFYYSLVKQRVNINYEIRGMKNDDLPYVKFEKFINKNIQDQNKRREYLSLFELMEDTSEKIMTNGIVLCSLNNNYGHVSYQDVLNFLSSQKIKFKVVAAKDDMRMIEFHK